MFNSLQLTSATCYHSTAQSQPKQLGETSNLNFKTDIQSGCKVVLTEPTADDQAKYEKYVNIGRDGVWEVSPRSKQRYVSILKVVLRRLIVVVDFIIS